MTRYIRRGNYYVRRSQAQPAVDRPPFEETPLGLLLITLLLLVLFIGIPLDLLLWGGR